MDKGQYIKDQIKNANIWSKLGIAPIEDKVRENRLRWFGHVHKRPIDATLTRIQRLKVSLTGERPTRTWIKTVRNDL